MMSKYTADNDGIVLTYKQPFAVPIAGTDSLELGPWLSRKHSSHATDNSALQKINSGKFDLNIIHSLSYLKVLIVHEP